MIFKQKSKLRYLCFFLIASFFIQIAGGIFTASSVSTWYPTLKKASWNPPPWVFGPVWTVLYIMIAIAGWLIYISPSSKTRKKGLIIFSFQLVVNFLWSYLFFYLKNPFFGFLDILLLLVLIGCSIVSFWRLSRIASLLFIPYFLWTAYAATLNGAICLLNKS